MALTYQSQGKYEKAFELYMKFVDILIKTNKEHHPTIATVYFNLGMLCNNTGKFEKSVEYFEKSIKVYEKNLNEDHPHVVNAKKELKIVEEKLICKE